MLQEMKNKFLFAPIKLGYANGDGKVNDKHLEFYAARSPHLGAIIPEPLYLEKGLRELPTQLGIDSDDKVEGLRKLTESIHAHGAKVIAHLNHPGRMANPKLEGNYHVSSSEQVCENGGAKPKPMNFEDMKHAVHVFRNAARRAEDAHFDAIEMQFGHGYLLAQFLSPKVNNREDAYGGGFENRVRFPLEVLDEVLSVIDIPVIARISGDEMLEDGIKLDEMKRFAQILSQKGVEAIHVSAGSVCITPPWFFQHMFIPKGKTWDLAAEIAKTIHDPVIYVGRVNSEKDIRKLNEHYHADYIAVGRGLVADPGFVGKYLGEVEGNIRPCLACAEGCLGGVKSGNGLHCVVNPLVGNDFKHFSNAEKIKQYAVVGGGLAGMEAALTLKARGHDVIIYEKEELGGQFNLAHLPPNKESLKEIVDYFKFEVHESEIPVKYQEVEAEDLKANGYDGVILSTGAKPAIPPVKGLDHYYWTEFLSDENLPEDQKILVIGGGLIGIEIASKLVDKNNHVIVVEMLDEIARGMEMIERQLTLNKLNLRKVETYTNYRVEEIQDDKVILEGDHREILEGIDKIVVAAGMKSYNPLQDQLEDDLPVYVIGDAKRVGKAQHAIRDAYQVAREL